MDDLKAVEVIRGPASVLYGADALGGVVLLRTRDATDYSLMHDWALQSALTDNISTRLHRQRTDADQQTEQTRTSFAFVNPGNPASFRGSEADRFTSLAFNQDTVSGMIIAGKSLSLAGATHDLVYGLSYEHTDTEGRYFARGLAGKTRSSAENRARLRGCRQ